MRLPALALLLFFVLLTGCRFDNPLSPPSKDINTWLLGVWEYKDAKGNLYRADVTPLSGDRYYIAFRDLSKKSSQNNPWIFEAWISRVGYSRFLTLHCTRSQGKDLPVGSYMFLHYQVVDQVDVVMRPLQLDSPPDTSSFKLREEARARLKNGTLLPQIGTEWLRKSEVYWEKPPNPAVEQPQQTLQYPL